MKIAILGTRGIPNHYGGFEQFSEYLSQGLQKKGHDVFVYNSHSHPYKEKIWKGINIIHKYDPENTIGTAGQFIYDLNCILDSRRRNFDIILQLGYTSSAIWGRLLPSRSVIVTNMDGLEWKRSKYTSSVRKLIHYFERVVIQFSDVLVSDSIGIQTYLEKTYGISSTYIPYGATAIDYPSKEYLLRFKLQAYNYDMLIARLEPENSIETILEGIAMSQIERSFIIVGNYHTKYGKYLKNKFKKVEKIKFLGSVYEINVLNSLRYYSNLYFHGHTVGGTNPSLLEAMASSSLICAHKNTFNCSILGDDAYYFNSSKDVKYIAETTKKDGNNLKFVKRNYEKIISKYSWEKITEDYDRLFKAEIIKIRNEKSWRETFT